MGRMAPFSSNEAEENAAPNFARVRRPRKLKVEHLAGDSFPIDRHGVLALPEQTNRALIAQLFKQKRLTNGIILEFLQDKFLKFIAAALAQDEAAVRANAEQNFAEKIIANFPQIKESGLKFEPGSG